MSGVSRTRTLTPACVALLFLGLPSCDVEGSRDEWVRVTKGDLVQEVEVTGEIRASDAMAITPPQVRGQWEYKIMYLIEEGQQVEPGARLLEFDTESLETLLEVAKTEALRVGEELKRRVAESDLAREDDRLGLAEAQATAERNRLKSDQPSELISGLEGQTARLDKELSDRELAFRNTRAQAKLNRDRADIAILRNKLERTSSDVRLLQQDIERMTVKSPRKGIVIHRPGRSGEKKAAGDTTWRGEAILDVVTLTHLYATASVDEVYSSQLQVGQSVNLRLDAYPDKSYEGRLRRLHQTIRREGDSTLMDVDIELTSETPRTVRPGMRLRGKVETHREKQVLQVPIESVFIEAERPVLYVEEAGSAQARAVKLGRRTDRFVQLLSGVGAGEQVLRNREREAKP